MVWRHVGVLFLMVTSVGGGRLNPRRMQAAWIMSHQLWLAYLVLVFFIFMLSNFHYSGLYMFLVCRFCVGGFTDHRVQAV